jgi:riboflavin biosynthesis pyrimidine reductase
MTTAKDDLMRLLPAPAQPVGLRGLYCEDSVRPTGTAARPFVYASFIASIDGRISLPDPETKTRKVPGATANPRDWRLFQELAACADVLVTSGRYMRDLGEGVAQASLPVIDKPEFADLHEWRRSQGLAPQPAVAIVSASLDLSIPEGLADERPVYVVTGAAAGGEKVAALEAQGARVLPGGDGMRVEGYRLVSTLAGEGFGNIAMVAGSELLNTLLADNVFDRLYLTQACRILGGLSFDTLLKGNPLNPPADFTLRALFHDAAGEIEQLFSVYDRCPAT